MMAGNTVDWKGQKSACRRLPVAGVVNQRGNRHVDLRVNSTDDTSLGVIFEGALISALP